MDDELTQELKGRIIPQMNADSAQISFTEDQQRTQRISRSGAISRIDRLIAARAPVERVTPASQNH